MREANYKHEQPAIWETLVKLFGVSWENTAVAYGDSVYSKYEIPPETKVHEAVHLKQQGYNEEGAKAWWDKYLADPKFRYTQELEAFRAEYKYLSKVITDRNKLHKALLVIATRLSGTMYGNVVTTKEAIEAIKK